MKGEPLSARLRVSSRAKSFFLAAWLSRGKITQSGFFLKPAGRSGTGMGAASMDAQAWQTLVVGRRITGVPSCSESAKAAPAIL